MAVVIHPYFISWKSTYLFLPESNLWACLPSSQSSTIFSNGDILEESLVRMKVIRKILAAGSSAGTQGEESLLNLLMALLQFYSILWKVTGKGKEHLAPTTSNRRAVHIPWANCFFSWLFIHSANIWLCTVSLLDTKDRAGNKSEEQPAFIEPLLSFPFQNVSGRASRLHSDKFPYYLQNTL